MIVATNNKGKIREIKKINEKITGFTTYHKCEESKEVFTTESLPLSLLFKLWYWATSLYELGLSIKNLTALIFLVKLYIPIETNPDK